MGNTLGTPGKLPMVKFPQVSLALKCKLSANAQKCRFPCVKSEMTACLGDDMGQKNKGRKSNATPCFSAFARATKGPQAAERGRKKGPPSFRQTGLTPPTESTEESAHRRSQQAAEGHAQEKRRGYKVAFFHRLISFSTFGNGIQNLGEVKNHP